MRTMTSFIFLAGLILLLGTIFQVTINVGQPKASDGSFAARLERPIRLAIVGDQAQSQALRASIIAADKRNLINREASPSKVADADAIVFLLNGWNEIALAPWQDTFQRDYAIIATNDDDSFSISMADANRPLNRTYLNLNHYENWGFECYAALFLHDIGGVPGSSIALPDGC